jgi:hypothetical protein
MRAAIRPYSIAVAPDSLFRKFFTKLCILDPLRLDVARMPQKP